MALNKTKYFGELCDLVRSPMTSLRSNAVRRKEMNTRPTDYFKFKNRSDRRRRHLYMQLTIKLLPFLLPNVHVFKKIVKAYDKQNNIK